MTHKVTKWTKSSLGDRAETSRLLVTPCCFKSTGGHRSRWTIFTLGRVARYTRSCPCSSSSQVRVGCCPRDDLFGKLEVDSCAHVHIERIPVLQSTAVVRNVSSAHTLVSLLISQAVLITLTP